MYFEGVKDIIIFELAES